MDTTKNTAKAVTARESSRSFHKCTLLPFGTLSRKSRLASSLPDGGRVQGGRSRRCSAHETRAGTSRRGRPACLTTDLSPSHVRLSLLVAAPWRRKQAHLVPAVAEVDCSDVGRR